MVLVHALRTLAAAFHADLLSVVGNGPPPSMLTD
jgi:hypothetical protein